MYKKTITRLIGAVLAAFLVIRIPFTALASTYPDDQGLGGFVNRVYNTVLEREYDQEGYDFWTEGMASGKLDAAKLMDYFIYSTEFNEAALTDKEYIRILYNAMMDREPDESGEAFWLDQLHLGMTRRRALACFIDSPEFTGICESYGVKRGDLPLTDPADIYTDKAMFVTRIYRGLLGRDPDPSGLTTWTSYVASGNSASDFLKGMLGSDEFRNRGLSDYEYMACLYEACLGRSGGEDELTNWIDFMNTHMVSRDYMLTMVIYSQEFEGICKSSGINIGTVTFIENRDKCLPINDFIINAFRSLLGRDPGVSDVNYYAGELLGTMTGRQFITSVTGSDEFKKKDYNNKEFVNVIYQAALGREASDGEQTTGAQKIGKDGRTAFLNDVYGSKEFGDYCKKSCIASNFKDGWNVSGSGKVYMINGAFITGWQTIDGQRYYFDPDTCVMTTGWKYIGGLKYYFFGDGTLCQDVSGIIGSQDSYYLTVNCTTNTIMVYAKDTDGSFTIPVKAMICSSSAGGVTPSGTFTIQRLQAWRELMGPVWGQYCSRITGNYLFHSVWYYQNGNANTQSVTQYNNLGKSVSHGCIRLTVADAKWIFDNCNGSQVRVFYSPEAAPFDRPVPPPITPIYGDYGHDPTDIWHG